mmetsp:Transcript_1886/g.4804  ORF Transcript_1886/g.4804 Transcript_1886/m.4804 type:complete len:223 (-) Transcript_1886:604-1272(-)
MHIDIPCMIRQQLLEHGDDSITKDIDRCGVPRVLCGGPQAEVGELILCVGSYQFRGSCRKGSGLKNGSNDDGAEGVVVVLASCSQRKTLQAQGYPWRSGVCGIGLIRSIGAVGFIGFIGWAELRHGIQAMQVDKYLTTLLRTRHRRVVPRKLHRAGMRLVLVAVPEWVFLNLGFATCLQHAEEILIFLSMRAIIIHAAAALHWRSCSKHGLINDKLAKGVCR